LEPAARLGDQLARRIVGNQGDDLGALLFGDAGSSSGSGPISEALYAFGVEAVEALPHGLWVRAELFGDLGGA
jgi:hypothetical protein